MPYAAHVPIVSADPAETPTTEAAPIVAADHRVLAVEQLLQGRPLAPYAAAMVTAADHHGIDWRLLPVISVLESQAGLAACGGNAWGFAKCQVRFASFDEGIHIVAATLASYGRYDSATLMCIWVSGDGCHSHHAIAYTHRGAHLYSQLGGSLPVRALPADPSAPLPSVQDPVGAAAPPAAAAPSASPTPAPAESTPTATPTEQATPVPETTPPIQASEEGAGE
jgi:hypothetical protein